uniref:DUF4283 domain-containing protein n=1 Tax=Noccaea caerulescens TaxID=107243 RepID=A0A1J3IU49_NOCCA
MSRRLSFSEKGKAPAFPPAPPRKARVKVPPFDNSKLIKQHSLTLIGRLTNPKIQRMGNLIPFFTEHWKVSSKPIGADLGQGLFQFQFETEKDLQLVLDNRPYHFSYWMLILQRWEPTAARTFPSQIPFWIQVQGVPVHLWSEETLQSIANDIGHFEAAEITSSAAKMRVSIDGLQPLIMSSMVEFATGEEVEATLVYEKLEKHCTTCFRLDHDSKDCPLTKTKSTPTEPTTRADLAPSRNVRPNVDQVHTPLHRARDPYQPSRMGRTEHRDSSRRSTSSWTRRSPPGRDDYYTSSRGYHSRGKETKKPAYEESRHSFESSRSFHPPTVSRKETHRSNDFIQGNQRWVEKPRGRYQHLDESRPEPSGNSRLRRPPLDRDSPPPRVSPEQLPRDAMTTAMGEIREVLVQYSSCADPSESAARKERLRIAEERGQVEESAAQMVRAALANQVSQAAIDSTQAPMYPDLTSPENRSQDRIPISQRLGPTFLSEDDPILEP